ncbi:hypothetical protein D9753_30245 [Streptomyces dangxiongensis]|uniref:Uncharacterized protein n=1 Tax=Streptomyces dangxiongensis TaxID=1442032 RepID=A0A3G2JJ50_9ACTN|nr:hypothetical protein D9753_30245 [Streptomyces dangxiongensis]
MGCLTAGPRPDEDQNGGNPQSPAPWNPAQPQRHATTSPDTLGTNWGELITSRNSDHRRRIEADHGAGDCRFAANQVAALPGRRGRALEGAISHYSSIRS